jgi:hypothetical protein
VISSLALLASVSLQPFSCTATQPNTCQPIRACCQARAQVRLSSRFFDILNLKCSLLFFPLSSLLSAFRSLHPSLPPPQYTHQHIGSTLSALVGIGLAFGDLSLVDPPTSILLLVQISMCLCVLTLLNLLSLLLLLSLPTLLALTLLIC